MNILLLEKLEKAGWKVAGCTSDFMWFIRKQHYQNLKFTFGSHKFECWTSPKLKGQVNEEITVS